ncbi:sugar ABC transporter permease [Ruminococcaceae bacterium OttesenSCG-928-A16]|nr:sugar ABC transporter permease [Ruminococcaceae bacterium OttesenSCG-928-A16]
MVKRMTFKQFLFILPLLVIIAVFSIYPIVSSFVYTVFDYRIYDQQYSSLYVSSSFNPARFYENCDYIVYYLQDEATVVDEAGKAEIQAISNEISAFMAPYQNQTQNQTLSGPEAEKIESFIATIGQRLNTVYNQYPNAEFYHQEDMPILLEDMQKSFIQPNFSGISNYQRLFKDARFWGALGITALFMVVSVSLEFVLGMALALIMNKAIKGIGLVRTTALIPWAIPTAVSALIWMYMYDGQSGVVSNIFAAVQLIPAPETMLSTFWGMVGSSIISDVWKTTPYMALLLLAGLQTIDRGLYESAAIDGSGTVNTFFRITLPLMKPSILVALLFRMLDAFRVYDLLYILTRGSLESLSVYAYKLMIGQGYYGYGSAVVVAMFACVAIIAFVFVKVLGAEVVGNDE